MEAVLMRALFLFVVGTAHQTTRADAGLSVINSSLQRHNDGLSTCPVTTP
jgi:hypothetical protein